MPAYYLVALCSALLTGLPAAALVEPISVKNIRTGLHDDRTRIVIDLSGPSRYRMSILDHPPRILLNIEEAQLATQVAQHPFVGTPVVRVSSDQHESSGLPLVFELSRQVKASSFALPPDLQRGDRVVIDLYELETGTELKETVARNSATTSGQAQSGKQHPPPPAPRIDETSGRRTTGRQTTVEFSGTWEHEWAAETDGADSQKFESVLEPRIDIDLPRHTRLIGIARIRADMVGDLGPNAQKAENYSSINGPWFNDEKGEFSLRELYLDAQWGNSFWRLGKQQVVWGQADGIKVMDVVNPQSFREFILDDFDDSRIPLWMVKAELSVGEDGNLQFLWIPDTTYHELAEADTPYEFTSSLLVPQATTGIPTDILEADKPDNAWDDSDAGLRYSTFLGGWDITLNYLYHYQDFVAPYQEVRVNDSGITGVLAPEYERNHLVGGTLSNVFGNVTLRAEAVYNSDTYHVSSDLSERGVNSSDEFASVIGLDWQLGSHDTLLSAQWFQSHLLDYDRAIYRGQTEQNLSLLYRRTFNNETWSFDALGLYSRDHQDRLLQVKLSYMFHSNLELWLGGDFFGGDNEGLYGQYSDQDRVLLGLELGF